MSGDVTETGSDHVIRRSVEGTTMSSTQINSSRRSIGMRCRQLARDTRGVAAVEFAMLVPLLFVMFIGTLELGQAVGLDRRVTMATASTADLIAREKTATDASLDGIVEIVKHLLRPYDSTRLQLSIVAVRADTGNPNLTRVEWSKGYNGGAAPARCETYTMPVGLLSAGSSAIVVETRFDYEPLIVSHYLNSSVTLGDKAFHTPRDGSCVNYNDQGCVLACP